MTHPTKETERLLIIDILRGFALLGILIVNIELFAGPESVHDFPLGMAQRAFTGWHAQLDLVIVTLKWIFVEGKMRSMFAMLFGASSFLLLSRIVERTTTGAADIFTRRNLWLALFGLVHGIFIWGGDILLSYGVCGLLFLYPARLARPRVLLAVGLSIWLIGGTIGVDNFMHIGRTIQTETLAKAGAATVKSGGHPTPEQETAMSVVSSQSSRDQASAESELNESSKSYLEQRPDEASGYVDFQFLLIKRGWILEVIGSMLTGMALLRLGFLSGDWSRSAYVRTMVVGYTVATIMVGVGMVEVAQADFSRASIARWLWAPYEFVVIPAVMANVALVVLLAQTRWARPVMSALGNVGKTAFSNYILTSLVCQTIFAWGPWHLFGRLEYYQYLYVIAALWALNIVASGLWLRRFQFGPLEWVWRSLTYWKRQPLLRVSSGTESLLVIGVRE